MIPKPTYNPDLAIFLAKSRKSSINLYGPKATEVLELIPIVAQEIRNLADDTKQKLNGMMQFVNSIRIAAEESKVSLNNTINSSYQMSEKIEAVSDTVSIHEDAKKSVEFAGQISQIDNQLSEMLGTMFQSLEGGIHAIKKEEILDVLSKAVKAHMKWIEVLKVSVDEMRIYPLQTNPRKCAFGYFYNAIRINYAEIIEEWKQVGEIHHRFHLIGDKAIEAIKNHQKGQALDLCNEAETLSKEIIHLMENIMSKLKSLDKLG
ncbi:hypothetical protein TXYLGN1_19310 [Tepidimicrobium xylanilyticum]|uniref:Chemoreceptor zinc-binding domain-containing protein n=2 Tax=Tepidimicrobium xylanilyticum TaxID=1123352 RepID=A0A1H3EDW6_9FIRM|nr:hypothetical protein EN5CB1_14180 [Tepidimicrobium xylanilyticum]SDX76820.1 Chemoreceptor zinc-binding domain-containing protein [Tepidimicrobium xylanilyticum]